MNYIISSELINSYINLPVILPGNSIKSVNLPHEKLSLKIICSPDTTTEIVCVDCNHYLEFTLNLSTLDFTKKGTKAKVKFKLKDFVDGSDTSFEVYDKTCDTVISNFGQEALDRIVDASIAQIFCLCEILCRKEILTGKSKSSVITKVKSGGFSRRIKSDITYIHIEKRSESISNKHLNKEVVWDHSFYVRGHWRYLKNNKIGKNRLGEYGEVGRTWVKEHKKLEHLPVKEMSRIITT